MLTTLSVLVENKPGVLARISGMVARRGFNIESLAVGPTEDPEYSRMTVVVDQEQVHVEQLVKQLYKLINVIKISELDPTSSVDRELLLVQVKAPPEKRFQIIEITDVFRGNVVDVGADTLIVEYSGTPEKLGALVDLLQPYGIIELARTGRISLERGPKQPSAGRPTLREAG